MPRFDSPEAVSVLMDVAVGDIRFTAGEAAETVVEVRPSDPTHDADVRAAEASRVEYSAGRLLLRTPKQRALGFFGRAGSVDIAVALPAGSRIEGRVQMGAVSSTGRLGECRVTTQLGDLQFDHIASLQAETGSGAVGAERVDGAAHVNTGSGTVRLRDVGGRAVVHNSNGDNWIGRIAGDLRVHTANGDISVERAEGAVAANSANGDVRVGVVRGSVILKTARGEIEIAVPTGTSARLDVRTSYGAVRNQLTTVDGPGGAELTADVRARTSYGDIVIRRAS